MDPDDPQVPKFVQHDYDPATDTGEREVDDRPLEEIMADAMTPEEYVLSSQEAMDSAIAQAASVPAVPDIPGFPKDGPQ